MAKQHSPGLYYQGFGGVEEVAGSKHLFLLVRPDGSIEKILHDCGSNMESMDGAITNKPHKFPFDAKTLDAVVLSHAHYDHVGEVIYLPGEGYNGLYYGHLATRDLLKMVLTEQVEGEHFDTQKYNQQIKGKKDKTGKFVPWKEEAFATKDKNKIIESFQPMQYGVKVQISENIWATFYDAGHILGSAQVLYEVRERDRLIRILMAADLGRENLPIIRPPYRDFPKKEIDYVFLESTYGNRVPDSREDSKSKLEEIVLKAAKDKQRVVIGAFSIMRTHSLLSDLYSICQDHKEELMDFVIYLDSPTAKKMNSIIWDHPECYDEQARKDYKDRRQHPFHHPNLEVVTDHGNRTHELDNHKDSDFKEGGYAIISASGMWFMGRILRHLKSHIEDPKTVLVITGWQKPGCLGWQLEQGREKYPAIKIEGEEFQYNASIERLHGYGAHEGGPGCVRHLVEHIQPTGITYLIHGEQEPLLWTQDELIKHGYQAEIVRKGKVISL